MMFALFKGLHIDRISGANTYVQYFRSPNETVSLNIGCVIGTVDAKLFPEKI
jgi:hypothetical protein